MASVALPIDDLPPPAYGYRPPRTRTCLHGKLIYGEGAFVTNDAFTLDCAIRDISEGGAKLQVFWKGWLPNIFDLADAFSNTRRTVRVVWVGLAGVGVRFIDGGRAAVRRATGFGRRQI